MAGNEDLPYWNPDGATDGPSTRDYSEVQGSRTGRIIGFGLLALVGLAAMVGLGYALGRSGGNESTAATDGSVLGAEPLDDATQQQLSATTEVDSESTQATADDNPNGDNTLTVEGTSTTEVAGPSAEDKAATSTPGPTGDDPANVDADLFFPPGVDRPDRYAVFSGGKVYLKGKVPSREVADLIADKAEAVIGPGNVIVGYEIDPSVTIEQNSSAPLFVKDVVLFEFNSTQVAEPFLPLLDLGVVLLTQNPQATMTIVTHTDSVGSASVNKDVSTLRAQAVKDYMVRRGAKSNQIILDPRGEEGASESDDAQTATIRRRAEFIITGLLN